jgi:hypothetical protein
MDKQVILHKLQKYQTKLRSNPTNYIYQTKVTQYKHMIGGGGGWRMIEGPINKTGKNFIYQQTKFQNNNKQYIQVIMTIPSILLASNLSSEEKLKLEGMLNKPNYHIIVNNIKYDSNNSTIDGKGTIQKIGKDNDGNFTILIKNLKGMSKRDKLENYF